MLYRTLAWGSVLALLLASAASAQISEESAMAIQLTGVGSQHEIEVVE